MANQLVHPGYISVDGTSNGQLLTTNGTYTYWANNPGIVNTAAQYTFTNTLTFNTNLAINNAIFLTGSNGTAGQVLTSNGTSAPYWSTPAAAVNVAATYAWTNTHTFSNLVTHNGNLAINSAVFLAGSNGTAGQVLTSNGTAAPYWTTLTAFSTATSYTFTATQVIGNSTSNVAIYYGNPVINVGNTLGVLTLTGNNITMSNSGSVQLSQVYVTNGFTVGYANISTYGYYQAGNTTVASINLYFLNGSLTIGNTTTTQTTANITIANSAGSFIATPTSVLIGNAGGLGANMVSITPTSMYFNGTTGVISNVSISASTVNATTINTTSNVYSNNFITANGQLTASNGLGQTTVSALGISISNTLSGNITAAIYSISNGTSTYNATISAAGYSTTGNTTVPVISLFATNGQFAIGNSTTTQANAIITIANSAGSATITPTTISVGNASINATISSNSTVTFFNSTANNSLYFGGLPYSNGSAGQFLTSNGTNAPYWQTVTPGLVNTTAQYTFTNTHFMQGSTTSLAEVLTNAAEVCNVQAIAANGTINYDVTSQSVLYYTSNATANWTLNFRGNSTTTLNALMSTGQSLTVAFLVTQGTTAFYANAHQVDGVAVTPKYQGGTAFSAGDASSIDAYVYTIIKTASGTYTVLTSQTQFK